MSYGVVLIVSELFLVFQCLLSELFQLLFVVDDDGVQFFLFHCSALRIGLPLSVERVLQSFDVVPLFLELTVSLSRVSCFEVAESVIDGLVVNDEVKLMLRLLLLSLFEQLESLQCFLSLLPVAPGVGDA